MGEPGRVFGTISILRDLPVKLSSEVMQKYDGKLEAARAAPIKCRCGGQGYLTDVPQGMKRYLLQCIDILKRCRDHPNKEYGIEDYKEFMIGQPISRGLHRKTGHKQIIVEVGAFLPDKDATGRVYADYVYDIFRELERERDEPQRGYAARSYQYRRRLVQHPKLSCDCCPLAT